MVSLRPDRSLKALAVLAGVLSAPATGWAQESGTGGLSVGTAGYGAPHVAADILETKTGEVTIPVRVSLLGGNAFTGIGALAEKRLLDNRLSLSVGETSAFVGDGMIGSHANPFAAIEARRAVNFDGAVWTDGGTTLSLGGSLLQSTITAVDQTTARPAGEERYRVFGSGARLGLFGGRVRGKAEFAWSLNERRTADDEPAAPLNSDGAHQIGIEADIINRESQAVSAYAFHRRIASGYRTTVGDAPADRDEFGTGGNVRVGPIAVEFGISSFLNNLDRAPSVLTMRSDKAWAGLTLDLAAPGRGSLLPSAIALTAHATDRHGMPGRSAGPIEDAALTGERMEGHGLAVHWGAPEDRFTLSWSTGEHVAQHADGNAAGSSEQTVALIRNLATPGWNMNFSGYLGSRIGHGGEDRSRTGKAGAFAAFNTLRRDTRRFNISVNLDHRRIWDPNSADLKVKTTWAIRTGAELLRLAPDGTASGEPGLSVYVAARGNAPGAEEAGIRRIELTAGVAGKLTF